MKNWILRFSALALLIAPVFLLATVAMGQNNSILKGQVLDFDGNPWPDVPVIITNDATGQVYNTKTDATGNYIQQNLAPGKYTINFKNSLVNYSTEVALGAGDNNPENINFKDIAAKSGYDVNALKKAKEKNAKANEMAAHFKAGRAAMDDADAVKQQLSTATADQKSTLQAKLTADYQTAITEFEAAQQSAPEGDKNLSVIYANLGIAYDGGGKYDQAVDNLQKSNDLKPDPGTYAQLGTDLARQGKMSDAGAACDKAGSLDPTNKTAGADCYKNIAIVLTNSNKMVDAIGPLQKASQLNPNDALVWYLLGNCLMNEISTKKEGGKEVAVIPPGAAEAYQTYLKLEPNGPHAAEAKASLQTIEQLKGSGASQNN
ncbi:MAG TPA: carboxypeptidase regulatory-like domain-containing protein [Candidatus Acidoferrales bacterium]|nr:carboxypeptidase regulatory-like domain-containing protein [Candidatus Acidoferrales bacterium]